MSDTNELIERLRAAVADERLSTGALYREAADTIARLEAERDAARREAMEECARILEALQQGATLADMVSAIRAAMEKP